ncbi:MAG: crosslink repair DNA glycosylase YcaQ family protein [Rudaea sp.]|nr:crosslink repair DNA glycosylase YcaQ family protein [Rudaea sp.]
MQQARNLHLAAQGLLTAPRARATRARVLATIARMRLLQIDTIHVVARSPYFVLFSRLGAYEQRWLDDLLTKGLIFESWAHEACFAPMSDYPLHATRREARANHWAQRNAQRMHRDHREAMDRLLAHIRDNGAAKASDFERKQKGATGWWGWKDEKRWLEAWFALGELMIARRENFQRVYDLRERVLAHAAGARDNAFTSAQAARECVFAAVRALGIAQARWIADYFRSGKKHKDSDLQMYIESGDLIRVPVRGWDAPGYVHREHLPLLLRARRNRLRATHTTLLSPFDPVVWDRSRASVLFGFDYTIECYTPGHKRRFGYFVLPILHHGRLVGRLDAKAHRAEGMFEVKAVFLQSDVKVTAALVEDVATAIGRCADWHRTPRVSVRKSDPPGFANALRAALLRIVPKA